VTEIPEVLACGKFGKEETSVMTEEKVESKLKFTGNWFFDAGVLGFVNLMEEIYGWDLEELQKKIVNDPEKIYYGYFPFGYLFYHSRVRTTEKEIAEKKSELRKSKEKLVNLISKRKNLKFDEKLPELKSSEKKTKDGKGGIIQLEETIKQYSDEISKAEKNLKDELEKFRQNINDKISDIIAKIELNKEVILSMGTTKEKEKVINLLKEDITSLIHEFDLKLPKDHRNFFIFNSKKTKNNLYNSFIYLYFLLREDYFSLYDFVSSISEKKKKDRLTYEMYPDSTVNLFLYSPGEFSNIGYTNLPEATLIREQLNIEQPLYLLLLSFGNSFQLVGRENVMFYTNSLEGSYEINKKFALYKEREGQNIDIFRVTWSAIIDALTEKKADFSLENMYLVEFGEIKNLKIKDVEYIGIPKLQASILLDDTIREKLNSWIQFKSQKFGGKSHCWLLEEFIKSKPLYPIILNHINLVLNQNEHVSFKRSSALYSLVVEAKILEFKAEHSTNNLFSSDYFDNYKALISEIKNEAKSSLFYAGFINQILADENIRKNIGLELLGALKTKNKISFLNILLKNINESSDIGAIESFMDWIFNRIIVNNISWHMYALLLVANLASNSR
jgi:hypothetical protein